jgi:uncharacterized membrane protein YgdD (TMEM256/DUF423 family)
MNATTQARVLLSLAGLSLLVATAGGAAGSHALATLDERALRSFSTAVEFQFFHGLGLIGIALVGLRGLGGRALWIAAWLLVLGIALFCGSIYATTFGAPIAVGRAAPYGGVSFMLGWLVFAASVWRGDSPAISRG